MKRQVPTILGFLIAPLIVAIVLASIEVVEGNLDLLDMTTLGWMLIFYCYALVAILIIGLPAYLLLNYLNKVTWWSAVSIGLLGGAIIVFVFNSMNISVMVPLGGLSAFSFWLIWRWET